MRLTGFDIGAGWLSQGTASLRGVKVVAQTGGPGRGKTAPQGVGGKAPVGDSGGRCMLGRWGWGAGRILGDAGAGEWWLAGRFEVTGIIRTVEKRSRQERRSKAASRDPRNQT